MSGMAKEEMKRGLNKVWERIQVHDPGFMTEALPILTVAIAALSSPYGEPIIEWRARAHVKEDGSGVDFYNPIPRGHGRGRDKLVHVLVFADEPQEGKGR